MGEGERNNIRILTSCQPEGDGVGSGGGGGGGDK